MSTLQEYADKLSKEWLGGSYNVTQMPGAAAPSTKQFYNKHTGYDYGVKAGTPIRSPVRGKVVFADESGGWGNRVGVYDPSTNKTTYLSHLSNINVKQGQDIYRNMLLGSTGGIPGSVGAGNTTGQHLDITEYMGNKRFVPRLPNISTSYGSPKLSYKGVLNKLLLKYKNYGRPIAISSNPERLKALGRKGKIIKVNF